MQAGIQITLLLSILGLAACVSSRTVYESPAFSKARNGIYLVKGPQNEIIQKTVFRRQKIVSSWEFMEPSIDSNLTLLGMCTGEYYQFTRYWRPFVENGSGVRSTFSSQGLRKGYEEIKGGVPVEYFPTKLEFDRAQHPIYEPVPRRKKAYHP